MLPKRTPRSANLSQRQQSLRRQILALNHPIAWSGAAVLVLSGLFLAEYWQPQSSENSSGSASARRNNPLLQGAPNPAFDPSARSASPPDLPLIALPGEAANPSVVPIDPALRPSVQSTQNKPPSNSVTAQPVPRPGNDASVSLYNPMGIPMPRNWENLSNSAQPSGSGRPAANPVATPATTPTAVSPLQSALDRMRVPVNPPSNLPLSNSPSSNSPQSTQAPAPVQGNPMSGNLGNGIPQNSIPSTGAIAPGTMGTTGTTAGQPNPTIPQPSYAPMPQTTGYTIPPAFRTPGNSSPYGSPTVNPIATPDVRSNVPLNPAPMPQSNSGQAIQNNSSGAIGGREINSFSNP